MLKNWIGSWAKKFEGPLFILIGTSFLNLIILSFNFDFLEASLYDFRMSHGVQAPLDSRIILITLDEKTTGELDEFAPLPLSYHAQFLENLAEMQPKAVGYLVDLNHVAQIHPEHLHHIYGPRFLKAAQEMIDRGSVFLLGTPYDVTGEILPPFPLSTLPHSISLIHKDGNVFAEDKVTRRALLTLQKKHAFHYSLAQKLNLIGKDVFPQGTYFVPEVKGNYFFFRYYRRPQFDQNNANRSNFPRFSYVDVLKKRLPAHIFKDKIVLVGTVSPDDSGDFAITPYSKASFTNPKILVHANVLNSILRKEGIQRIPNSLNGIITILVTTSVIAWNMTCTPLFGMGYTVILGLVFVVINHMLFQFYGIWIRESQPLIGIISGYYLSVPYRLIREYKKRWTYQRRNELLTQVEELKRNFLSLVTHDLKTPVARIQGLAELLIRKSKLAHSQPEPLHYQDKLNHIVSSAEELNHFISSILELSKIESNPLSLHFESKDVNLLIEKAVEGLQEQACSKEITIHLDLEPLFPIKLDPALISKVLNNVIDNAVKYSPPTSVVSIKSREENEQVVISVQDQGIGMTTEEQRSLFTQFYRAKNDTTTAIPGTGLGLYLTKYFIEIHMGKVEVESEKDKGSVFRIFLPIQQNSSSLSTYLLAREKFTKSTKTQLSRRRQENV